MPSEPREYKYPRPWSPSWSWPWLETEPCLWPQSEPQTWSNPTQTPDRWQADLWLWTEIEPWPRPQAELGHEYMWEWLWLQAARTPAEPQLNGVPPQTARDGASVRRDPFWGPSTPAPVLACSCPWGKDRLREQEEGLKLSQVYGSLWPCSEYLLSEAHPAREIQAKYPEIAAPWGLSTSYKTPAPVMDTPGSTWDRFPARPLLRESGRGSSCSESPPGGIRQRQDWKATVAGFPGSFAVGWRGFQGGPWWSV